MLVSFAVHPEAITTLSVGYSPAQNKKLLKRKETFRARWTLGNVPQDSSLCWITLEYE